MTSRPDTARHPTGRFQPAPGTGETHPAGLGRKCRGVSFGLALVEVLLALVLIATGAAALLRLQLQATRIQQEQARHREATWIVQACLSRLLQARAARRAAPTTCPSPPGWRVEMGCRAGRCTVSARPITAPGSDRVRLHVPDPLASS
ncbi:MAG: hypothetical protein D6721_02045 [Gammaproteobacteria bacterium]|nr:MAG: hypothetical protein D6721_02045 [Gammaproteobacteria bacterium]